MQVALIDKQTLQKAIYAWKLWNSGKKDRRAKLRRAMNRITRGCLARAFYRWRERLAVEEKSRIQRKKVLPQFTSAMSVVQSHKLMDLHTLCSSDLIVWAPRVRPELSTLCCIDLLCLSTWLSSSLALCRTCCSSSHICS